MNWPVCMNAAKSKQSDIVCDVFRCFTNEIVLKCFPFRQPFDIASIFIVSKVGRRLNKPYTHVRRTHSIDSRPTSPHTIFPLHIHRCDNTLSYKFVSTATTQTQVCAYKRVRHDILGVFFIRRSMLSTCRMNFRQW